MVISNFSHFSSSETPPGAQSRLGQKGFSVYRQLPENAGWAFEPAFYNQNRFLDLKKDAPAQAFYLVKSIDNQPLVQAVINFLLTEERVVSLAGAPFGGPDFREELPAEILDLFLQLVVSELQNTEIKEVEIRLPARGISARSAEVSQLFHRLGFAISLSEINHHLPVGNSEYENRLHQSAKRRLKKLLQNGFEFIVEPASDAVAIFRYIEACRREKGFYLSLTLEELQEVMLAAPDRYQFFSVRRNHELVAATIGVLSCPGVLYNYAPAHSARFNTFSPVILLTQGLVNWCRQQNLQFLDLGTSTLNRQPNQPLIAFKEHLGGIASEKLTLVRKF